MNGGWKTEPRWKGCAADGGRARREWKRGERRVCVRARVGGEREKAREKERESGEHAAKRVIESRARSLLYRPPYAYPVPFSQHQNPLFSLSLPIIRLHLSLPTTRHRCSSYFFLSTSDFSPSVFIFRRSASRRYQSTTSIIEKKREEKEEDN